MHGATDPVDIAIVGKYVTLKDAYLSVIEALKHGGLPSRGQGQPDLVSPPTSWWAATSRHILAGHDGILVPGGFGIRGVEGKVEAIRYARERQVPYLGLCLGLQCAVIEFARNVCGLEGANSSEFEPETPHPVIDLLPEQEGVVDMGAPCAWAPTRATS